MPPTSSDAIRRVQAAIVAHFQHSIPDAHLEALALGFGIYGLVAGAKAPLVEEPDLWTVRVLRAFAQHPGVSHGLVNTPPELREGVVTEILLEFADHLYYVHGMMKPKPLVVDYADVQKLLVAAIRRAQEWVMHQRARA